MNEKHTEFLIETFQPLYEYCKYFECGDGWFELIKDLSDKLNQLILIDECSCRASQVKEKYGTLRYYMDTETDAMSELIRLAEKQSHTICEICGEAGKLREGRWISTLCDKCATKLEKK